MGKQFVVDPSPELDHDQFEGRIELFNEDGTPYTGSGSTPVADYVGDADGTDTTTLAASVDAIRDALVNAGLMAAS